MPIKTILVACENEAGTARLARYAAAIGERTTAHVTGVATLPSLLKVPAAESGTTALIDELRAAYRTRSEAMRAVFEQALALKGVTREWRLLDPQFQDGPEVVAEAGYAADLIIGAQEKPANWDTGYRDGSGLLAVLSARPVLLLPEKFEATSAPRHAAIAYDGSQQSTRAVFDALDILKGCEAVTLLCAGTPDEGYAALNAAAAQQRNEICATLSRHGIHATIELIDDAAGTSTALLDAAGRIGADLLVIGAYGHSRVREWLFGGVTRSVLQAMPIPVLLSH